MNLEKYKNEMARQYPDRALVEATLSQAKKSTQKPKSDHRFLKAAGSIGLSAAVLAGAFFGAGAVRGLFKDIDATDGEETTVTEEISEEADRITATDNELSVTPLSNPKYTVKADTPDGKVSLDENTTPAEMLACGVPVETENGILGMQYFCEVLRKYKNHEPFEFIFADVTGDVGNRYYYYNYDGSDKLYDENFNAYQDDTTYWEYQHRGYLSVNKYGGCRRFASRIVEVNGEDAGIKMYANNLQGSNYGIVTIYDALGHRAETREEQKKSFFEKMTEGGTADGDGRLPLLSVIYNGECLGKFRMNFFIENIENGAEYAAVQYTDITTTDEYEERYYSIEYCQGVYSIFTMTNGLDGVFDAQYFDGCTVIGNEVIFDNGNVRYAFALSEAPEADAARYDELIRVFDNLNLGFYINWSSYDSNLNIAYDERYIEQVFSEKLMDCIVINEEYSENGLNAVKLSAYRYDHDYARAILYLDPLASNLFTAENGAVYWLNEIAYETYDRGFTVIERDEEQYILLSDRDLARLKSGYHGLSVDYDYSASGRRWLISETAYKSQSIQ